jgi:hypothetical protein
MNATGLFRTSWAGLVAQRRRLVVSATIEEKEGVVGWLLENEVNQEPENVDHNDEDPKRIEIESKLPVHPRSYPVDGVCVGASLEDVDGETNLTEKKEWLEQRNIYAHGCCFKGEEIYDEMSDAKKSSQQSTT